MFRLTSRLRLAMMMKRPEERVCWRKLSMTGEMFRKEGVPKSLKKRVIQALKKNDCHCKEICSSEKGSCQKGLLNVNMGNR
jgi:hypothetical protein